MVGVDVGVKAWRLPNMEKVVSGSGAASKRSAGLPDMATSPAAGDRAQGSGASSSSSSSDHRPIGTSDDASVTAAGDRALEDVARAFHRG